MVWLMAKRQPLYPHVPKSQMPEEQKRLIHWTIGDIVDGLHELEQRLFYKVEAEMCEGGKVKPEFNPDSVLKVHEAKEHIVKAVEVLMRIR
jgi:hypothetical protein